MSIARSRIRKLRAFSWVDLVILSGMFCLIYALVGVAAQWTGPFKSAVTIDLSYWALPKYAAFSLVRGFVAYAISLAFTILYGYWAAHSRAAERVLIPLLDILQSIPVLGFLPVLVLALVNLVPGTNIGLEIACILMIFTGQVWNMTFSFYASVRGVPPVLRDMASIHHLRRFQILKKIEIPYSTSGLLWNSMLSMAGGWFFLMVVESFTLGDQSFRLPGLGAYMAVAIESKQWQAMWAGMGVMILMIILVDRCLWAPLVYWAQRFQTETKDIEPPWMTVFLQKSNLIRSYYKWMEGRELRDSSKSQKQQILNRKRREGLIQFLFQNLRWVGYVAAVGIAVFGLWTLYGMVDQMTFAGWTLLLKNTVITFLRVTAAVVLGSLWTIPLGVFIGMNPHWTRRLQPVVQVVAAFPAPMVFPAITLILIRMGVSFEWGSVILMLVGSQWYILFNVISGATLIPDYLKDVGKVFQVRGFQYWKLIILPAIFPSLVNGWITAAGGAWNASIVSELVRFGSETHRATGIGSSITVAAENADYQVLAAGIVTMIGAIIFLNRFFWSRLYNLAENRFRLE